MILTEETKTDTETDVTETILKVYPIDLMMLSKPLNTERTVIRAMVPMATPATEMAEMILMAFCDFFASKYLLAIYSGRFISFYSFYDQSGPRSMFQSYIHEI